jgi:transcriptional regulator with XRE-family HTH domain
MLTLQERARGERLGARLRAARGSHSLGEVAAASGVPAETLRKIEAGRIPTPAFFTVVALAATLGLPLAELAAIAADPRAEQVSAAPVPG